MVRPKVVVGFPFYGDVIGAAKVAHLIPSTWMVADEDRIDLMEPVEASSSLLPDTFNTLLCHALFERDHGRCDLLAILHSDIAPCHFWLTKLWQLMRTYEAHAMSAVVPMKDQPPDRTSTAIGDRADWWTVKRHIRLADRHRLPETFSAEDVCQEDEVLLVNTGCLLLDLQQPWWDDCDGQGTPFCFDFCCKIEVDPLTRRRRHWCQPEDWRLSRMLADHDARVFATWGVPLGHHGKAVWNNQECTVPQQPVPRRGGTAAELYAAGRTL
jgi:hypothetical protein